MACCRSDYSLYDRSMAGWLHGAERQVINASALATPATLSFDLWPFDRPESRSHLMSIAIRRSASEVLLIGGWLAGWLGGWRGGGEPREQGRGRRQQCH